MRGRQQLQLWLAIVFSLGDFAACFLPQMRTTSRILAFSPRFYDPFKSITPVRANWRSTTSRLSSNFFATRAFRPLSSVEFPQILGRGTTAKQMMSNAADNSTSPQRIQVASPGSPNTFLISIIGTHICAAARRMHSPQPTLSVSASLFRRQIARVLSLTTRWSCAHS